MGDVLPFRKLAAPRKGLCQHAFHRWQIVQEKQFDVQRGRLVTVWRCDRCGERKVTAD